MPRYNFDGVSPGFHQSLRDGSFAGLSIGLTANEEDWLDVFVESLLRIKKLTNPAVPDLATHFANTDFGINNRGARVIDNAGNKIDINNRIKIMRALTVYYAADKFAGGAISPYSNRLNALMGNEIYCFLNNLREGDKPQGPNEVLISDATWLKWRALKKMLNLINVHGEAVCLMPGEVPVPPGGGHVPPPGHGAPPPGHGAPPPGHGAPPPGHGAPPPGHGAPPPGHGAPPPGHGAPPPGHGAPPPGHGAPPPGHGAPPPAPNAEEEIRNRARKRR